MATGPATGECNTDGDCSGNVCARDGMCHPPSTVREVKTTWTIQGREASVTTCGAVKDLQISFDGSEAGENSIGYAPVPCENGQFFMDKLPRSYTLVELGKDGGFAETKVIGPTGEVAFDLRN